MKSEVRFGPLLQDEPPYKNPGVIAATNVVPRKNSFGPVRDLTAITNALSARCLGTVSARDASDNVYIYAGDASALYESVGDIFTDESKAGGYSTAISDNWEFAIWGRNQKIIATNYVDAVQSMDVGGGASGAFADMITTSTLTPKAKRVGIIGDFVVLGFTNDAVDGEKTNRVWWSGIGDETDFDPDSATQCDFQDLASGGTVQKIIGGADYGLVFQQSMIRTMRYVGGGVIFDLLPLNFAPGTSLPNSVIAYKGNVFYIAQGGFYALRGTEVQHIGDGRVDRAFSEEFDPQNARYLSAAIDPVRKIVAWAYPGSGATTLPNKIIMCNYDDLKWAYASIDTEFLLTTETQGYSLDTLDTVGTDIDNSTTFDESLDSDKWKGGTFRFAAFDHSHVLSFFTGATLTGVIETGDLCPVPGRNWQVDGITPLVDGGDVNVSIAKRSRLQDSVSYGVTAGMNVNGYCPFRSEGKYQRFRFSLSSSTSWSHIQGFDVEYSLTGER